MDFSVWKTACRFCGRLAETDECKECQELQEPRLRQTALAVVRSSLWMIGLQNQLVFQLIGMNPGCALTRSIQQRIFGKSSRGKPPSWETCV